MEELQSQQWQWCCILPVSVVLFLLDASYKEFVIADGAVWLPSLLLEDSLAELPQTEGAHKVLGVKLAIQSRDAAARDGLTTATAESALPGVKVQRAEGSTIQLHETAVSERLQTVLHKRAEAKLKECDIGKDRREKEGYRDRKVQGWSYHLCYSQVFFFKP